MLIIVSSILYGGTLYYVALAQKWDLAGWLYRFRLGIVVQVWQRGPEGRAMVIGGFILFLMLFPAIGVGFGGGPSGPGRPPEGEWVLREDVTVVTGQRTLEGATDEATPTDLDDLDLLAANLTLGWNDNDVDEPGPGITPLAPRNQPDTFRLIVTLPDGTEYTGEDANDPDSRLGEVRLSVPMPSEGNITFWVIEVECVEAGDVVGPLGRVWATDDGNDWTLRVEYTHREWVPADS